MIINEPAVTVDSISLSFMEPDQFSTDIYIEREFFLFLKTKIGLFGFIGNFFKNADNRVLSKIIKPIGRFVSHTIQELAGKVLLAIKSGGGSKAIEFGGQVVDKGKEVVSGAIDSAGKFVDKVNPLNNIGFFVVLGLGALCL